MRRSPGRELNFQKRREEKESRLITNEEMEQIRKTPLPKEIIDKVDELRGCITVTCWAEHTEHVVYCDCIVGCDICGRKTQFGYNFTGLPPRCEPYKENEE